MRRIRFRFTFDIELGTPEEPEPEISTHAVSSIVLEPPDDEWDEDEPVTIGFQLPRR